jgi:uncharacterized protein
MQDANVERIQLEGYGKGGFRVSGARYDGSMVLTPYAVQPWSVTAPGELTVDALDIVIQQQGEAEIILLGMGYDFVMPSQDVLQHLRGQNLVVDFMDTGAACRTFTVLASEERRVMAALIAV